MAIFELDPDLIGGGSPGGGAPGGVGPRGSSGALTAFGSGQAGATGFSPRRRRRFGLDGGGLDISSLLEQLGLGGGGGASTPAPGGPHNVPNLNPGVPNRTGDPLMDWYLQNATGINGPELQFIAELGLSGGLDPGGSQQLIDMLTEAGISQGRDTEAAARSVAAAGENDPLSQALAATSARVGSSRDLNATLQNARLQSAMTNQDRLFSIGTGGLENFAGAKSAEHLARIQAALQPSGIPELIGGVVGAGIGALPGLGGGGGANRQALPEASLQSAARRPTRLPRRRGLRN